MQMKFENEILYGTNREMLSPANIFFREVRNFTSVARFDATSLDPTSETRKTSEYLRMEKPKSGSLINFLLILLKIFGFYTKFK